MRRNRDIPDIKQRLTLFELFFDFSKAEDWLDYLGYTDESSVSRVKNGKQGVSDDAIKRICDAAGIKNREFFLPLIELADLLDVADESDAAEIIADIAASSTDMPDDLHAADRDVLSKMPGKFVLIYPGREEMHIDRDQMVVEKFEVTPAENGRSCRIVQIANYVSGERAEGQLTARNSAVLFNLEYKKSYYPDSTFLMQPIVLDRNLKILSGLYLDVAPMAQLQIFSTQCCMFSVPSFDAFPRRYPLEHDLFSIWRNILDNKTEERGRLISKSGDEFYERVRRAVIQTIEKGEA